MRNLRIAALLVLLYGAAVVLIGVAWYRWTGESGGFLRVGVRVAGSVVIAVGLWRAEKWAWWVGAVFSAALAPLGLVGVALLRRGAGLGLLPNTLLYWGPIFGSIIVLAAAFVLLLMPSSRRAALRPPPL